MSRLRSAAGGPWAAGGAVAVVAAVLVTNVEFLLNGGLWWDDWWMRAEAMYSSRGGRGSFFDWVDGLSDIAAHRPAAIPLLALVAGLGRGTEMVWTSLATLGVLSIGLATLFALRVARMPAPGAVIAAVLVVVVPFADVTHYWGTAIHMTLPTALVLAGLGLGGLALRRERRRPLAVRAAIATVLFVWAALTYEAAVGLLVLAPLVYASATGWRWKRAIGLTAAQAVVVGLALKLLRPAPTGQLPAGEWADHASTIARESAALVRAGAVPEGGWGILWQLVVAGLAAWLVVRVVRDRAAVLADLRGRGGREALRWALWGLVAVAAIGAGYLVFVPAPHWYHPFQPGQGSRVNVVATVGIAGGYAAAFMLIGTVVALGARRARELAVVAACVLGALSAGSLSGQTRDRGKDYIRAAALTRDVLAGYRATMPSPPRRTQFVQFGTPGYVAPGVDVATHVNIGRAAVQTTYGDGSIAAYAVVDTQPVVCAPEGVRLPTYPGLTLEYADVVFIDPLQRRMQRVPGPEECARALPTFPPGPLMAPLDTR